VYDSRGIADGLGMPLHVSDVAAADRDLFGGTVPTVWLQQHFSTRLAPLVRRPATVIYTSHFHRHAGRGAVSGCAVREVWKGFISR